MPMVNMLILNFIMNRLIRTSGSIAVIQTGSANCIKKQASLKCIMSMLTGVVKKRHIMLL